MALRNKNIESDSQCLVVHTESFEDYRKEKHPFTFYNFIECMKALKSQGYFYNREWILYDADREEQGLWQNNRIMVERFLVASEWQEVKVTEICICFRHFLTGEEIYCYIKRNANGYRPGGEEYFELKYNKKNWEESVVISEEQEPYFNRILRMTNMFFEKGKMFEVSRRTLEKARTDSFLTLMRRNRYVQKKVGRITEKGEDITRTYWAGEFCKEDVSEEYLYIVVVQEDVNKGYNFGKVYCNLIPKIYVICSLQSMNSIKINYDIDLELQDLPWLGMPLDRYYNLPDCELRSIETRKEWYAATQENLTRVFEELSKEGYHYRREMVWEASEESKRLEENISAGLDIKPEYSEVGLERIQMEFVHPVSGIRKWVVIEEDLISVYIGNGHNREYGRRLYSISFLSEQYHCLRYYGEEKSNPFMEEVIFPEPLFEKYLKKCNLISEEQIKIIHLAGKREFKEWFCEEDNSFDWDYEEEEKAQVQNEIKSKLARARRIMRSLNYKEYKNIETSSGSVEIYTGKDKKDAFYLLDEGLTCKIKYVDEFMDVDNILKMRVPKELNTQFLSLDELEIGMRVSVLSLSKVVGTRILLDAKTYESSESDIGYGTIVYIGNDGFEKASIDIGNCIIIFNEYDLTKSIYYD